MVDKIAIDYIQHLIERVGEVCKRKNWKKDWSNGGCYIHLEVSEFIESLRGKGNSLPEREAGDILITLFAVLCNYNISAENVLRAAEAVVSKFEKELSILE